jgi:serine/threonine protein kinase
MENYLHQFTWEFSESVPAAELHLDSLDWANPASIPGAQLIKENGQRQVWRVDLAGNSFYAKLYFKNGKQWRLKRCLRGPDCLKEWRVARYALDRGINCVVPVAYALAADPGCPVDSLLITEGKPLAPPLTDYWRQLCDLPDGANRAARISLLEDALAELLARAHQAGLAHSDLHPGNLLVETHADLRPKVCLVDLHSVRVGTPVSDREAIYNLAQLNQWFRQNATLTQRMRLLKQYMVYRKTFADRQRGRWSHKPFKKWAHALDRAAQSHADKLLASRDRRIWRDCKYFAKILLPNYWLAHVFLQTKHPVPYSIATSLEFTPGQWRESLRAPELMLEEFVKSARPIKNSRSTLVCRGTLQLGSNQIPVVAKRYFRKKPFAALWDCLRKSRALRAWKTSFAMLHRALPVAQPLAVLERRIGPYLTDSIFITEEVRPSINLRFFITSILPVIPNGKRQICKMILIDQIAGLLRKMHQNGFAHRDMKATNILIFNMPSVYCDALDPQSLKVVLVDLDGIKIKRKLSCREELRALIRLSLSADLSPNITTGDRARFLKSYLTCYGSGLPDWKTLWRNIQSEREKSFQDHIPG